MPRRPIVPCLWFDDQAEQAVDFYTQFLPDSRITALSRYPESADNPSGKPRGSVMTVEFEVGGQRFTALNGGPHFTINPSISFFIRVDTQVESEQIFLALAGHGKVLMPLAAYPWSESYGWIADRFGVSWQVITGRRPLGGARVVPCLMFAGKVHGRAEEALGIYSSLFPEGGILSLERYAADEGPEGTIKHGRCVVDGQELIAMDSHIDHGFTFNEAVSFQVMCSDQSEIDRYWGALSDGGATGRCGWLKDRFGVSWQVVPSAIAEWMTCPDTKRRDRAFSAMLKMQKLDISSLKAALDGTS